jgi:hypothetical protein
LSHPSIKLNGYLCKLVLGGLKEAGFRDANRTLNNFDCTFNPKMNRSLVFDLATCRFIDKREDALFIGQEARGNRICPRRSGKRQSCIRIAFGTVKRTYCSMNWLMRW